MRSVSETYQIIWLIRRLFRAMGRKATEKLEVLGITAADRAVMEFLHPREQLSVPEIADRYLVSRQHIQVTVNSLLEKKLVTTRRNPRHKKSPLVTLNSTGRALFASIRSNEEAMIGELFSGISEIDRDRTRRTLTTLLERLSQEKNHEIE